MADLTEKKPDDVIFNTLFGRIICEPTDTVTTSDPAVPPSVFKSVVRVTGGKTYTLTLAVT